MNDQPKVPIRFGRFFTNIPKNNYFFRKIACTHVPLNDPELILAYKPSGNLDTQTSVEVMKVLQKIHKSGRSILMATHDYSLILKYPFKTLKCDGNKIFEVVQRAV